MTNTVQDKVKTDWQQVQSEGGQRLSRIRAILKAATSEAVEEFKAGSNEIQALSRQSLADMISQLKEDEQPEGPVDPIVIETAMASDANDLTVAEVKGAAEVPTWRQLFIDFWHIANDRKGEWSLHMLSRLRLQMDQFDADMVEHYGERYRPFQRLVKLIRALVEVAYNRLNQTEATTRPVAVDIMEDGEVASPSSAPAQS